MTASARAVGVALAVAVAVAVAVAGCGSAGLPPGGARVSAARPGLASASLSPQIRYARLQMADCALWSVLAPAARRQLLVDLRRFFGAPVDGASARDLRGGALTDAQAQRLFAGYCRLPFAASFKLYKLYGRSAALSRPAS